MTTFPGAPRIKKGAIVSYRAGNSSPAVVLFQYNPTTLSRRVEARRYGDTGSMRLAGAPTETIQAEIIIDATDDLENEKQQTIDTGVLPQIAALEILLYPSSSDVVSNAQLANLGVIEIAPPPAPFTLFIYGVNRVLPVTITGLEIVEEAHDTNLNPIRASVSVAMQVLTYNELGVKSNGGALFLAHQTTKEVMAGIASANGLDATGLTSINL